MFPDRILVFNPQAIFRVNLPPNDFTFKKATCEGEFYLVMPSTAREICYLQMLGKNIDVFLPYEGAGLLVKRTAIDTL
tara:strand:- start:554 stop:787 length:234 start_codon:yes stop_codon:yes gene_type:complete